MFRSEEFVTLLSGSAMQVKNYSINRTPKPYSNCESPTRWKKD